jgi:hypothetical protein
LLQLLLPPLVLPLLLLSGRLGLLTERIGHGRLLGLLRLLLPLGLGFLLLFLLHHLLLSLTTLVLLQRLSGAFPGRLQVVLALDPEDLLALAQLHAQRPGNGSTLVPVIRAFILAATNLLVQPTHLVELLLLVVALEPARAAGGAVPTGAHEATRGRPLMLLVLRLRRRACRDRRRVVP